MKTIFAMALVAVAFMAAGSALAHTTVDASAAGGPILYVPDDAGDATVYQESNGLDGLQQHETETEDGRIIPPDDQIA